MNDGEALYRAILAAPEDDTPRLVYADWLDENGESERAEFIRLQIELANLSLHELVPWNKRANDLRAREKTLLEIREREWLSQLKEKGEPLQGIDVNAQFRRGFVEIVWMTAVGFCQKAETLLSRVPVRELRVTRSSLEDLSQLMLHPLLGHLRGLDLSDRKFGNLAAQAVAWSPYTNGLQTLRLRGCGITDEGASQLAEADFDRPLLEVDVSLNPISPRGVQRLAERFGDAVRAERMERTG